jgi:hypothetical protein
MTIEEFENLERGDIVRGKHSTLSYVVDAHHGYAAIGVRSVEISNPSEWDLVKPPPKLYCTSLHQAIGQEW